LFVEFFAFLKWHSQIFAHKLSDNNTLIVDFICWVRQERSQFGGGNFDVGQLLKHFEGATRTSACAGDSENKWG